ncbi:MAG: hypothetical protein MUF81_08675 [Verrucomicrobia bacterium]|jgi:hypothetical protein|nr:hypothetical protein [Verrucomicrobiota bacterium]
MTDQCVVTKADWRGDTSPGEVASAGAAWEEVLTSASAKLRDGKAQGFCKPL